MLKPGDVIVRSLLDFNGDKLDGKFYCLVLSIYRTSMLLAVPKGIGNDLISWNGLWCHKQCRDFASGPIRQQFKLYSAEINYFPYLITGETFQ